MEYIKKIKGIKSKITDLVIALILFSSTVMVMNRLIGGAEDLSLPNGYIYEQTRFIDGYDWWYINNAGLSAAEKQEIKTNIVEVIFQSAYFNMAKASDFKRDSEYMVNYADSFYLRTGSLKLPVFWVMKLADVAGQGISDSRIKGLERLVIETLETIETPAEAVYLIDLKGRI